MRLPRSPADAAMLLTLLYPLLSAADGGFNCEHTVSDGVPFAFKELGGARSVMVSKAKSNTFDNTTYTIDVCRGLTRVGNVPTTEQCPHGTRVCAIERSIKKDGTDDTVVDAFPIAGQLKEQKGKSLDAKWERLKASKSHSDEGKEGLRVEMRGGFHQVDGNKRFQKAIIEFICDPEKTGLENLYDPEDKYDDKEKKKREEQAEEGDSRSYDPELSSLQFVSYGEDSGDSSIDTLRLNWFTRHACEDNKEKEDAEASHWGFFTWFILIAFLSTATYLIFGSWLNYNRYGARGWDLLPHSDTIRDIPYLLRDWIRRVVSTLQGGGSRGGYAAV